MTKPTRFQFNLSQIFSRFIISGFSLILAAQVQASPLSDQVAYCQANLPVDRMPGPGSCTGENTYPSGKPNDRLGYFRLSDSVDAVYTCENIDRSEKRSSRIEMIIHNRSTGNTCFFVNSSPETNGRFSSLSACTASRCDADNEWASGSTTGVSACTHCHKNGGPYFMGSDSINAMAHFGLVNDNHVTNFEEGNRIYNALHYTRAGRDAMEDEIYTAHPDNIDDADSSDFDGRCGASCHNFIRVDEARNVALIKGLAQSGEMPPTSQFNPYRWINRDTPANSGDFERLSDIKSHSKFGFAHCDNPEYMQAHVIGDDQIINSSSEYAKLRYFNPRDGLICKNSDIPSGSCPDYEVRFLCQGLGWTNWQDNDNPSGEGDHERPPEACINPREIEARRRDGSWSFGTSVGNYGEGLKTLSTVVRGFPDRLEKFDNKGLICRNSDQVDGSCANYAVRFICPD